MKNGDLMIKRAFRKRGKGIVSLLLIISVMASLIVPFDLTVYAEDSATGSEICALLYYIDPNNVDSSGKTKLANNLELVFQRGDTPEEGRENALIKIYTDFADRDCGLNPPWYDDYNSGKKASIYKVNVKDRIAPTYMAGWFWYQEELIEIKNIENIDTSQCKSFYCMFNYSYGIHELDLTSWDTSNVETVAGMFSHQGNQSNRGLRKLNISNWTLPKCTSFSSFLVESQIEELDISSMCPTSCRYFNSMFSGNKMLRVVKIGPMSTGSVSEPYFTGTFENCINLESVYSEGEPIYGKVDLSAWTSNNMRRFNSMFLNCAKIREIDFGENIQSSANTYAEAFNSTFEGCTSLETIRFNFGKGAFKAQKSTFKNCINLTELDFSGLETKTQLASIITESTNIYEGCDNLKQVTFNEHYPTRERAGTSVPPKETWAKIKDAAGNKLDGKQVLPATQLFLDFQSDYAGTWVAVDKIVLDANGGKPAFQSINGSRGMEAVYDEPVTASRAGYTFDGWWSEKDGGSKLQDGVELESWTYYAHWNENTYNLVLNGNGGLVPEGFGMAGATVSADRETITFNNISYTQFVNLSSGMFSNNDGSVLASWNIRKNGTSTQFAANDSVNKLAVTQGDTATLYAQWHIPSAVITFDPRGGSAVASRDFEIGDRYGTLGTPTKAPDEASHAGYTFVGWFTKPDGQGLEIVDKADDDPTFDNTKQQNKVTESRTLYAYWMPNCAVIFDANGGSINNADTEGKVCMYNQEVGKLPVPENGSASFDGWFTQKIGGTQIHSNTVVNSPNVTYYAHWGYRPKFETDGGSYISYSEAYYPSQDTPNYMFNALPTVDKYRCEFLGWYADEDGDLIYEKLVNELTAVDLSRNSTIKAMWNEDARCTVTLDAEGGAIPGGQTEFKFYKDGKISGLPVPVKSGAEFGGWYSGDDKIIEDVTTVSSDLTLTARWIEKDCTVTFNANGGALYDPANSTVKVVHGKTLPNIPGANKKEADGSVQYFFGGWFENADGTGNQLTADTVITESKTYYAKWVDPKNYMKINDEGTTDMSNTLYMYSATWGSPSDGSVTNDTGNNLVFHPISSGNISALLRIQFYSYDNNSSTDIKLPPGSVKIKIPKYIFKDRDGTPIGTDNLHVGLPTQPSENSEVIHFYYTEVEENGETYYVIINSTEMTGKHDDFEIFYQADPNKMAGGYIDENGYYRFVGDDTETAEDDKRYFSNSFNVEITVDINDDGRFDDEKELDYTKQLSLDLHTKVNTTVEKIQTDVSMKWKSAWGSEPADSDEYYYVTWALTSKHSGSTQPFALSWSEDTVRDGAIIIPPDNHPDQFLTGSSYSTVVVTKHRKDSVHRTENGWLNAHNEAELEVTWKSGYKQRFRANADAYAYIEDETGIGGSSSTFFNKRISGSPEVNDDHYIQGGQERVLIDETISLDYVITLTESKRDTAPVWNERTGTYTTPERTMVIEDGASGDLVLSPYSKNPLPSESDWNTARDVDLSENDYYFDRLEINVTEYDAIKMNETWSNPFVHEDVNDYSNDGIMISIRRAGKTEIENLKPIAHTSGTVVDLPNDTVWFKVSYSSSFYTTDLMIKPTVCIKPTNHIKSYVSDHIEANMDTMFKNRCRLTFIEGNNEPVVTNTGENGTSGWYSAFVFNIGESKLYSAKSTSSQSNIILDNENSSESIPIVISGWGYNTTGNKKPMRSASFYDLIPEGYSVDRSSVFVIPRSENSGESSSANANNYLSLKNSSNVLASAYYSVSFSENWNNCGRTLMTVNVNIPDNMIATGVDVYYLMDTTYASIIANGATPNNIFAYKDTTPGQSIPIERSRMISDVEAKYRSSLAFADSNQTAFNSATLTTMTPSNISSGIKSTVKTDGVKQSNHQIIGRNTDYSYAISYNSDSTYRGENLVLYDLIERQVGTERSEWYGELKSIDISGIKTVKSYGSNTNYCAPVVYYSTKSSFRESDLDVDNAEIWTITMPPLNEITAVAVDCRKNTSGSAFILDTKKCLSFNVNMHSPSDADNNITAYNEAYVRGNLVSVNTSVDNITQTRVTVRYKVPQFVKDAFPSSGTIDKPESVVKNSVLEYVLKISNPDDDVPMENVTIEDILCDKVRVNNAMTVQFNEEAPVSIDKAAGVTYEVSPCEGGTRFSAVIDSIAPNEMVIITIPVTVTGETGDTLTNTANVLSINGIPYDKPVDSNPTYHVISDIQVKILKGNSKGVPLAGAVLQILDKDKNVVTLKNNNNEDITSFVSTNEVIRFNLNPGNYYLHEVSVPTDFKSHADVAFRIDSEGIIYVDNQPVNYVEMRDEPTYKVIFHENNPEINDKNVVFRTYEPNELNEDKSITHFYDIPTWAGDEYVFAGWYHNSSYTVMATPDNGTLSPSDFEYDTYPVANPNGGSDPDYHLYAKWIKVGTVEKSADDTNSVSGYRGFGLSGVQIRPKSMKIKDPDTGEYQYADMYDPNIREQIEGYTDAQYNDNVIQTPDGMRFVTSLSERLLSEVNGIVKIDNTPPAGKTFGVEYGYVVGTEDNINSFVENYNIIDKTAYNLQYQGENVNGVDTTGKTRSAETDYRYITNVDCTSKEGSNNNPGVVKWDHRNFTDYRLYTLVVTYDDEESRNSLDKKINARAYMRYYDANGKLRVFYNTYKANTYFGGCMCSFNQVSAMAQ